jgi:hypothetical protein
MSQRAFVLAPGEVRGPPGEGWSTRLAGVDTGGLVTIGEADLPPMSSGPSLHVHTLGLTTSLARTECSAHFEPRPRVLIPDRRITQQDRLVAVRRTVHRCRLQVHRHCPTRADSGEPLIALAASPHVHAHLMPSRCRSATGCV